MEPTAPTNSPKPSKVEAVKIASEYLKTFVADEFDNGLNHFSDDAASILKFHGSYQQDDRDLRTQLKREKKDKAYQFMVRVRVVGGKLTADQFLACHELARTRRQRHAADHDPPGVPAPRRLEERPGGDDPTDQRVPALDPGRLRRRRAQRPVLPRADPRLAFSDRASSRRPPLGRARRTPVLELLGHLARRREDRVAAAGRPVPGSDPGRRPGRAALRQGVPAAQVQDGLRLPGR